MTNFDFEEWLYIGLLKHCCQNEHDNITHKTVQLKYLCMLHLNSDKRKKSFNIRTINEMQTYTDKRHFNYLTSMLHL